MPSPSWPTSLPNAARPDRSFSGALWLLTDMSLNIWALTIVKALGLGYPVFQIVFIRALTGLVLMLPFIYVQRASFRNLAQLPLHGLRILFSTLALSANYYAVAHLPFALFSALAFTRPIFTIFLAGLILREVIPRQRWGAAALAFLGVLIALRPGSFTMNSGVPATFAMVIFGTLAIITMRKMDAVPTVVMMTFYTLGLSLVTAPIAWATWTPLAPGHALPLLAVGAFAQAAQFCFLMAHRRARASFLAVLGYLSLILTTAVGYVVFDEVPTISFAIGAALIVFAAYSATRARPRT